jgi:hypothetical protein
VLVGGFQQQRSEIYSSEVCSIEIGVDVLLQRVDSNLERVSPPREDTCIVDDAVEGGSNGVDLLSCDFEGVRICGIGGDDLDTAVARGGEGLELGGLGGVSGCGEDGR